MAACHCPIVKFTDSWIYCVWKITYQTCQWTLDFHVKSFKIFVSFSTENLLKKSLKKIFSYKVHLATFNLFVLSQNPIIDSHIYLAFQIALTFHFMIRSAVEEVTPASSGHLEGCLYLIYLLSCQRAAQYSEYKRSVSCRGMSHLADKQENSAKLWAEITGWRSA